MHFSVLSVRVYARLYARVYARVYARLYARSFFFFFHEPTQKKNPVLYTAMFCMSHNARDEVHIDRRRRDRISDGCHKSLSRFWADYFFQQVEYREIPDVLCVIVHHFIRRHNHVRNLSGLPDGLVDPDHLVTRQIDQITPQSLSNIRNEKDDPPFLQGFARERAHLQKIHPGGR